jgi:response regulator of citrate/malate metabolism
MERVLSVLLVEDDQQECQEMIGSIEAVTDIQLLGVTNNTVKAQEYVRDFMPDVIILDLELHKGYGDGLSFLRVLREMDLPAPITCWLLPTTSARLPTKAPAIWGLTSSW